ncbi:MAG: serine--tRNA ligase [Candidatus Ryanbacteria bacterium]|nr:serine--tRNA ligase [Candidatus Ryanbacteria bacterium]
MLDIKFIRENPSLLRDAARKKHIPFDVEKLLDADRLRRERQVEVDALRTQLNTTSEEISRIEDAEAKRQLIEAMRELKKDLGDKEKLFTDATAEFENLMYQAPNIPDPSVPDGASDADNREIRQWGTKPSFSFVPKDHITILRDLDLADFENGIKVAGFRGYFLKREAVLLEIALWQFAMRELSGKGYIPINAPSLVREENFTGTGYFPQGKEDVYQTQDGTYLVGTAEVSVMGMLQNEILSEDELPKKFVAISPCFRREAGSHGKDTKGLYRVHEFRKVEQVVVCKADHMESVRLHEELLANSEELLQKLGLHYRVVLNCGADIGLGQVKKYDIETWIPSQEKFGETHSASYFHDFQTRRLNLKYRDADGTSRFAHSLNNTAVATPRLLISLLEQNQQADGSIHIPEVLQPYIGMDVIRR